MSQEEPPDLKVVQGGKRGKSASRRGFVTLAVYEQLAALFVVQGIRTVRGLSRQSGISTDSCSKAITTGWPERGWPPLRQRAAEHDALQRDANKKVQPLADRMVIAAMHYQQIRHDNLMMAKVLRETALPLIQKAREQIGAATFERHGTRTRIIDVKIGKRIVQRVVKEDVVLPPSAPQLAQTIGDLTQALKIAGEVERVWSRYEAPDDGVAPGWDALSDQQLKEYVESGGTKLPEGFTIEQLAGKT